MSDGGSVPVEILLVGATGMVGRQVMERAVGRRDVHLAAIARREVRLPRRARMEMLIAEPDNWGDAIRAAGPDVLVIALGTTLKAVGGDKQQFRAVDYDLVLSVARAAKEGGVRHLIAISSIGAASGTSNFYLCVKGEVEDALVKLRFERLDIIRPGLLVGRREGPVRWAEKIGMIFSPVLNMLLQGGFRKFRAIRASVVADVVLALATSRVKGRFIHDYDGMQRVLNQASRRYSTP